MDVHSAQRDLTSVWRSQLGDMHHQLAEVSCIAQ